LTARTTPNLARRARIFCDIFIRRFDGRGKFDTSGKSPAFFIIAVIVAQDGSSETIPINYH